LNVEKFKELWGVREGFERVGLCYREKKKRGHTTKNITQEKQRSGFLFFLPFFFCCMEKEATTKIELAEMKNQQA